MYRGDALFSECIPSLYLIDKSKHQKQMASIKVKFRPSTVIIVSVWEFSPFHLYGS